MSASNHPCFLSVSALWRSREIYGPRIEWARRCGGGVDLRLMVTVAAAESLYYTARSARGSLGSDFKFTRRLPSLLLSSICVIMLRHVRDRLMSSPLCQVYYRRNKIAAAYSFDHRAAPRKQQQRWQRQVQLTGLSPAGAIGYQ